MVRKQNHVIKIYILSISIFMIGCSNYNIDDDYAILNKVVEMNLSSKDTCFYLWSRGKYPKDCLKKYYIYRYDKNEYNKIINRFDSLKNTDSINYAPYGKYIKHIYFHTNCINDSLFNKESLQFLIKQKDSIKWDIDKIKNDKIIILESNKRLNNKKKFFSNSISKPIYSKDKELAIVVFNSYHGNTKRLTLKKINGNWQIINEIVDHL